MYTRCPECETVFRLSASALKKAGGKVRCGACDSTFNALQSLAEDFINPDSARQFAEQAMDDGHISKEQGEALLNSLEKLEIPDVELEDTGVEWRVLTPPAELVEPIEDDLGVDTSGIIVSSDDANLVSEGGVDDEEDEDLDDLDDDDEDEEDEDLDDDEDEEDEDLDDDEDEEDEDLDDLDDDEDDDLDDEEDEDLDDLDDEEDDEEDEDLDDLDDDEDLDEDDEDLDDLDDDEEEDEDLDDLDDDEDLDGLDDDEEEDEDLDDLDDDEDDEEDDEDLDDLDDDEDDDLDEEDLDEDDDEDIEEDDEASGQAGDAGPEEDDSEPRYDDNSPLPEGADEESEKPARKIQVKEQAPPADVHAPLAEDDLDLGPPEEWEDLLDEVEDSTAETAAAQQTESAARDEAVSEEPIEEQKSDTRWTVEKAPAVESIVMEGDTLSIGEEQASAEELKQLAAQLSAATATKKPAGSGGKALRALAILLMLTLFGQVVHNQRETLATLPYFPQTLGMVYRFFGYEVVPRWDVRRWQFEDTGGNTVTDDQVLRISSTLSNQATKAMPYPMIQVVLTDLEGRVIETQLFGPRQYLEQVKNLRTGVAAGQQVDASLRVPALSAQAAGFKLNICYPAANRQLRCAAGDFLH